MSKDRTRDYERECDEQEPQTRGMVRCNAKELLLSMDPDLGAYMEPLPSGLWVVSVQRPTDGMSRKYTVDGLWICDEVMDCPGSEDVYHRHEEDETPGCGVCGEKDDAQGCDGCPAKDPLVELEVI